MTAHEDTRTREVRASSNRGFGLVIGSALAVLALWPLIGSAPPRWWAGGLAVAFVATALARPAALAPLNRAWTRFGLLLGRIVQPVIMAALFYGAVTPTALIMRLANKDPLQRRFDPSAKTYWVEREPVEPESMRNQF